MPPGNRFAPSVGDTADWYNPNIRIGPGTKIQTPPVVAPEVRRLVPARPRRTETIPTSTIGVPNPYGAGVSAYEPETEVYEPDVDPGVDNPLLAGYDDAYNAVQRSRAEESQAQSAAGMSAPSASKNDTARLFNAGNGTVGSIINAARTLLGKPYVWGGSTSSGVDCSGLIFYAFNQAGIKMPRYRAIDYGKMGTAVDAATARAGDLVYWDNPNTTTDHVGIYLGDGYVIQAPQTGDVVKVSKVWGNAQYRRVLDDGAFGSMAQPTGAPVTSYRGKSAAQYFLGRDAGVSLASPVQIKSK